MGLEWVQRLAQFKYGTNLALACFTLVRGKHRAAFGELSNYLAIGSLDWRGAELANGNPIFSRSA